MIFAVMTLTFPPHFFFGTSTAAEQIETAFEHDWQGLVARDGSVFDRTTDHEKRLESDVALIASVCTDYRMSLMWSKLQRSAYAQLNPEAVSQYHRLFELLAEKRIKVMLVLHHFVNPAWFAEKGGWANSANVPVWVDYAKKVVNEFGGCVSLWNTFNEPNNYATLGYIGGEFPPFRKNILAAISVVKNMAKAHGEIYRHIKQVFPDKLVGISHNCAIFKAANFAGKIPASLADRFYMSYLPGHFTDVDFVGLSYYAAIAFDPMPVTQLLTPEKISRRGVPFDDIWEYYPDGLGESVRRYWKEFGKPIIITENGFCSSNDTRRVGALRDYAKILHKLLEEKVDIRGYYHWTTWDNFEWTLGPTYRFGLYSTDLKTMERTKKPSADVYSRLSFDKQIDI